MRRQPDAGLHATADRPVDIDAYEQYIGRWSRPFVPALIAAGDVRTPDRVLDVASGTGEAALVVHSAVGASGVVVATDISAGMLGAARERLPSAVRCVVADGQDLPFGRAAFDSIVCQLGLMFFPQPTRGLIEFKRILESGRRAAVCVISCRERAPMWGFLAEALIERLPEQWQQLQLSFSLADADLLGQMFAAAGFSDIAITRNTVEQDVGPFDAYWAPIEEGPGQMPQAYRGLPEAARREVREGVRAKLARFSRGGRLVLSVEMLIASGRA